MPATVGRGVRSDSAGKGQSQATHKERGDRCATTASGARCAPVAAQSRCQFQKKNGRATPHEKEGKRSSGREEPGKRALPQLAIENGAGKRVNEVKSDLRKSAAAGNKRREHANAMKPAINTARASSEVSPEKPIKKRASRKETNQKGNSWAKYARKLSQMRLLIMSGSTPLTSNWRRSSTFP